MTPGDLSRVKFEQHPGQQISRDLVFRDEKGRASKLGNLFENLTGDSRPWLLPVPHALHDDQ